MSGSKHLRLAVFLQLVVALSFNPLLAATTELRVVACDQLVKSSKRGLCINEASAEDFLALAPSVSWYYSWHYADTNHAPEEAKITFIPMVWGNREADLKGLAEVLKTDKPPFVLGINEPNLKDQAFIDPATTAKLYQKILAVTEPHKIPLIAPNMALGSSDDASITAYDPFAKEDVTYTFMTPFLKAVFHDLGLNKVEATAAHTYGNFAELKWMVGMMHDEFERPVWVTEFADWHAKDEAAERAYLIQSVDFMERTSYVKGYAWFKERVEGNSKLSILAGSGELTPLGRIYVAMPVHDPAVYYQLPGRLQLESYLAGAQPVLAETSDDDGFLEMRVLGPTDWLDYNVAVDRAGDFEVRLRASTKRGGEVRILADGQELAKFVAREQGWQTLLGQVTLPQGTQTLRVVSDQAARLNWLEFGR